MFLASVTPDQYPHLRVHAQNWLIPDFVSKGVEQNGNNPEQMSSKERISPRSYFWLSKPSRLDLDEPSHYPPPSHMEYFLQEKLTY